MKERRLLDEHVFAAGERPLCQVEMEARGNGDDDGVNAAIRKGFVVAAKGGPPLNRRRNSSALARSRLA